MSQLVAQKNSELRIIQSLLDTDGRTPKTGLAGTVGIVLRDEDGAAAESVAVEEQGASGYYEFAFTPLNGRGTGYSYFLQITEPAGTSAEGIYGFEVQVYDSVSYTGVTGSFLTTLANVKSFLGIKTADTAHDDLLSNLIARVTSRAGETFGRTLIQATLTEIKDGEGRPSVWLSSPPIASVASVHESADQVWDADSLVDADDYIPRLNDASDAELRRKAGVPWLEDFQSLRVIYDGGFSTIPAWLEDAAIKNTAWWFNNRLRLGLSSTSLRETAVATRALLELTDDLRRLYAPLQTSWFGG